MWGLLAVLFGILRAWLSWRASDPKATRVVSLRKARRLARKMAGMLEGTGSGSSRRETIVRALIAQGVPEPLARICVEEAAARYALK